MSGKLEALNALKTKIEAGDPNLAFSLGKHVDAWPDHIWSAATVTIGSIMSAHDGSLDAARALHEAILPGLPVKITDHSQEYLGEHGWCAAVNWPLASRYEAWADNPARAWLLAILKALIAIEEASE